MAELGEELRQQFMHRMVDGLVDNNVLRGSWAEQLAAHFLGAELQRQWSYFDLLWEGHTVSVKHSVGRKATFSVARSSNAWDWRLDEGWVDVTEPTHLCDLYVFAHMASATDTVTLAEILDPQAWRFAVCTASDMSRWFPPDQKTATVGTIASHMEFVTGDGLPAAARGCLPEG
jgi:hypothetical protein